MRVINRLINKNKTVGFSINDNLNTLIVSKEKLIELIKMGVIENAMISSDGKIRGKNYVIPNIEANNQIHNSMKPNIVLISKFDTKTSRGMLSKGWYKINSDLFLVKGNSADKGIIGYEPYSEVLASRLLDCIGFPVVKYELMPANYFKNVKVTSMNHVSVCKSYLNSHSKTTQFSKFADRVSGFTIKNYWDWLHAHTHLLDISYLYKMLIGDAIIGNQDRHLNNWDVIEENQSIYYAPMMDFGASLLAWCDNDEINRVCRMSANAIGIDRAKPFNSTHSEQIKRVLRAMKKSKITFNSPHPFLEIKKKIEDVLDTSNDIFCLLPVNRANAIKKYVIARLRYLEEFF